MPVEGAARNIASLPNLRRLDASMDKVQRGPALIGSVMHQYKLAVTCFCEIIEVTLPPLEYPDSTAPESTLHTMHPEHAPRALACLRSRACCDDVRPDAGKIAYHEELTLQVHALLQLNLQQPHIEDGLPSAQLQLST